MWKPYKNIKNAFQNPCGITKKTCEKEVHVIWFAKVWKMWFHILIYKIILVESSTNI